MNAVGCANEEPQAKLGRWRHKQWLDKEWRKNDRKLEEKKI
jgi:hypothetical protein